MSEPAFYEFSMPRATAGLPVWRRGTCGLVVHHDFDANQHMMDVADGKPTRQAEHSRGRDYPDA